MRTRQEANFRVLLELSPKGMNFSLYSSLPMYYCCLLSDLWKIMMNLVHNCGFLRIKSAFVVELLEWVRI